jgi:hypothetical protein
MNLEGSLESFGLPDVLTLLASTKKTGALHLRRTGGTGLIRMREGAVSAASGRMSRRALASRLVASGLLSDDALESLVELLSNDPERGLIAVVLDAGMVGYNDLVRVASEAAVDAVGDLLSWPEGFFSFDPDEPDPEPLDLRLQVGDLVAEGARRQESLQRLGDRAPSDDAVVAVAFAPEGDLTVSSEEWRLLALVDGRRALHDVVALAGGVEHDVRTLIAELLGRGLLVSSSTAEEHLAPLLRRQGLLAALESDRAGIDLTAPELEASELEASELEASERDSDVRVPVAPPSVVPPVPISVATRTSGSLAMATQPALGSEMPNAEPVEEDAAVTKSLLLRLIAGVRGL